MITAQPLPWDSEFFKLKIGKIQADGFHALPLVKDAILRARDFNLIYIFITGENPGHQSPILGQPVDVKYTYSLTLNPQNPVPPCPDIKEITSPSEKLYSLAFQSGHESRYKKDTNFKEGEFERFYTTWIDNSLNGSLADHTFGYYDGDELIGFVTLKIKGDTAQIGLIAVDSDYRGKGAGSHLIDACIRAAREAGANKINVATQKNNSQACKFYQKNGFTLQNVETIFHKWI